jgi:hypothetical protein
MKTEIRTLWGILAGGEPAGKLSINYMALVRYAYMIATYF